MKHSKILSAVFGLTLFASAALCAAAPKTEGNIKKIRPKKTVTLDVYTQLANY